MNRTIKFRGQRKQDQQWIYGFYFFNNNAHGIIHGSGFPGQWAEVIPETVGQFTGLLDKNGKEIYEGDILEYPYTYRKQKMVCITQVIWKYTGLCIERNESKLIDSVFLSVCSTKMTSVIGNIHSNPELLNNNR